MRRATRRSRIWLPSGLGTPPAALALRPTGRPDRTAALLLRVRAVDLFATRLPVVRPRIFHEYSRVGRYIHHGENPSCIFTAPPATSGNPGRRRRRREFGDNPAPGGPGPRKPTMIPTRMRAVLLHGHG